MTKLLAWSHRMAKFSLFDNEDESWNIFEFELHLFWARTRFEQNGLEYFAKCHQQVWAPKWRQWSPNQDRYGSSQFPKTDALMLPTIKKNYIQRSSINRTCIVCWDKTTVHLFLIIRLVYICETAFSAVLSVKVVSHEDSCTAFLTGTLSSQSGNLTVLINL